MMDSCDLSKLILDKLASLGLARLKSQYFSSGPINHLVIDDLFPVHIALRIASDFPENSELRFVNQIQESKYVGVDFANNHPLGIPLFYLSSILQSFGSFRYRWHS